MLNKSFLIGMMLMSQFGYSQNAGFGGKKVLVKMDLINGVRNPFFSANVEYLFLRNMSLAIGFKSISYNTPQKYRAEEYATDYDTKYSTGLTMPAPEIRHWATVKSKLISVEYKFYFPNSIPAPYGLFVYLNLAAGVSSVSGNYYQSLVQDLNTHKLDNNYKYIYLPDTYHSYHYSGLISMQTDIGVGYNRFFSRNLFIGARSAITIGTFNLTGNPVGYKPDLAKSPEILSSISKTYGDNVVKFPQLNNFNHPSTTVLGLSIYLHVGILLF